MYDDVWVKQDGFVVIHGASSLMFLNPPLLVSDHRDPAACPAREGALELLDLL